MPCLPIKTELPLSLAALFSPLPIAVDRDGDGVIDGINLRVAAADSITAPVLWAAILNLTARLAFISVATDFPLVPAVRRIPAGAPLLRIAAPRRAETRRSEVRRIENGKCMELRLSGSDPACMARLLDCLETRLRPGAPVPAGWRTIRLAAQTGTIQFLDENGGTLAQAPVPPEECGRRPVFSASDAPLAPEQGGGLEALLDLGRQPGWFTPAEDDPRQVRLGMRLHLAGERLSAATGVALGRAVVRLCAQVTRMPRYPVVIAAPPSGTPVLRIVEAPPGVHGDEAVFLQDDAAAGILTLTGGARPLAQALEAWSSLGLCRSGTRFAAVEAFRRKAADFKAILDGQGVWGRWAWFLAAGRGTGADPPGVPPALARRIAKACERLELAAPTVRRERGLKRTFVWRNETERLLEAVDGIPAGSGPLQGTVWASKPQSVRSRLAAQITAHLEAKGYRPRLTVCNAYKPGLCWLLEEILPQLAQRAPVGRIELGYQPFTAAERQLELRSRWLQEIFPGPDLVAQALDLDPADIQLVPSAAQADIYRLRAWSPAGDPLIDESFSPLWQPLQYRAHDPEQGWIHPTTAGFRLRTPSGACYETRLPTDRQVFWNHFQEQWLPQLEARMQARLAGEVEPSDAAFWETLRIAVEIDETDERLGPERDRICPMEALHEDLYFFLLDAFQHFSAAHRLPDTLGLGAVLPVVAARTADATPRAVLTARPLEWPRAPRSASEAGAAALAAMVKKPHGGWEFRFRLSQPAAQVRNLAAVAQTWGYDCRTAPDGVVLKAASPGARRAAAPMPGPLPEVPTTTCLSRAEAERVLDHLAAHKHIEVWTAGRSLRGRPIRVIEAFCVPAADVISVARLRLVKPTLLVNARHHANEISGTPAALRFMADLAGGRLSGLLQRANAVCIPMENIDGLACFEAIAHQGRDHKLHAARYNAVGAEFYADYFRSPPRFGEAAVKPLLWRRWLPELMVDLHGVPGHEWEQPFAGYTPARFEQFWIPNTFVYAIMPFLEEPEHPLHAVTQRLIAAMRRALGGEAEIIEANRKLADRYQRYARGPEPEVFPAAAHEILSAVPPLGRTRDINFARRYPRVTRSEIVVEVPDEGSDGQLLHLCVQAHFRIQEALIEALAVGRDGAVRITVENSGDMAWQAGRMREHAPDAPTAQANTMQGGNDA